MSKNGPISQTNFDFSPGRRKYIETTAAKIKSRAIAATRERFSDNAGILRHHELGSLL
jgi:hypothetical protein